MCLWSKQRWETQKSGKDGREWERGKGMGKREGNGKKGRELPHLVQPPFEGSSARAAPCIQRRQGTGRSAAALADAMRLPGEGDLVGVPHGWGTVQHQLRTSESSSAADSSAVRRSRKALNCEALSASSAFMKAEKRLLSAVFCSPSDAPTALFSATAASSPQMLRNSGCFSRCSTISASPRKSHIPCHARTLLQQSPCCSPCSPLWISALPLQVPLL
eukprot:scaffold4248_cov231-Pinguiococcus_pyrenoidosus.AAC.2